MTHKLVASKEEEEDQGIQNTGKDMMSLASNCRRYYPRIYHLRYNNNTPQPMNKTM
jgi:hypothetical protein